ncbi:hypothetical protein BC938DRAFT_483577 [Jimgerdemannia flammicorona]|uniref:AMP-dependent synthetase/ligase domain-containing protein n=1 Tax=Jimgerdemannia flammicorona TaxID=994334 RepID=A0A433QBS0_9FUNG|nr:hypothetical protein BC938DRAFT_483577 [Jimgerdemannia flammicorona]
MPTSQKSYSVEVDSTERIFRSRLSPDKLVDRPLLPRLGDAEKTVARLWEFAAEKWGDRRCFGWRDIIDVSIVWQEEESSLWVYDIKISLERTTDHAFRVDRLHTLFLVTPALQSYLSPFQIHTTEKPADPSDPESKPKKWSSYELSEYRWLSYTEAKRASDCIAIALKEMGIKPGDRVLLFAKTR